MGKGKLNRKCRIYSELGDVGRVLGPVNSQRTPPPPPPPATLSQLGPWSSISEERSRTCRFHSFRCPCRARVLLFWSGVCSFLSPKDMGPHGSQESCVLVGWV